MAFINITFCLTQVQNPHQAKKRKQKDLFLQESPQNNGFNKACSTVS